MIDKIAGALPATGATSPTSGPGFEKALSVAKPSSSFKPASAKPAARPTTPGTPKPAGQATATAKSAQATAVQRTTSKPSVKQAGPAARAELAPAPVERPGGPKILGEVQRAQARLDSLLKMAESGRTFSPAELLAFQAHAYRASQELDLAGKVVEKGTSAVKQTLQTQL